MSAGEAYDIRNAIALFFVEAREMLAMMEESLLSLEKNPLDAESINTLFRSVHTIKGSSGMFALEAVERFAHEAENVLDGLRRGAIGIDDALMGVLLDCHDHMARLIDRHEMDPQPEPDGELAGAGRAILERLRRYGPEGAAAPPPDGMERAEGPRGVDALPGADVVVAGNHWHISLRFGPDLFRDGLDPRSFIAYLGERGRVSGIVMVDDRVPGLDAMDPESCYLGFEISFEGVCGKQDIIDVFEFAGDDCDVRVLPPQSRIGEFVRFIRDINEPPMRLGEILVAVGSLTEGELEIALSLQSARGAGRVGNDEAPLLGDIVVNEKMVHRPVVEAALVKQRDLARTEERKGKSLRIDSDKLDDLINNIGELVIIGSTVRQQADRHGDAALAQSVDSMSRLIGDVRDRIMDICMVPIGDTFRRFERMVRDLGRESGKEIDLVINGGDAELDKTIIEKITDPLMHLVRNSIDHGIDVPAERERKGKPPRGAIAITAYHETGNFVIEIADDGNGLDRERIRSAAIEKGMLSAAQTPGDDELFQLIFAPGFSTAGTVTSISGRGVGMDVVKKNVEALRGSIDVRSVDGEGVMIRINLPLTLAIIDGFMVAVNGALYIVPLDLVREVVEVGRGETAQMDGANIVNLRGEALPFMRLREFFGQDGGELETECVLVVECMRRKAGIVVDRPVGEFQTVIKPLGAMFRGLDWVSGATIIGTGEVVLILDVPRIVQGDHRVRTLAG